MKRVICCVVLFILLFMLLIPNVRALLVKWQRTRPVYEYVLSDGTKGYSKHCFDTNGRKICRDIKTVVRVVKFEEVK